MATSASPARPTMNARPISFIFSLMSHLRTTRVTALVLLPLFLLLAGARVGLAGSAIITTLHINEIESNGGTPDDWVELTNTGATTIDISGWKMLDNDDTHPFYVFPSGSTIAPGGYLVVDVGGTTGIFGLGSADSVRIFDPSVTKPTPTTGPPSAQPYESYAWTAHAATTYGRCPDGTGPFVTTGASTKAAKNNCNGATVQINEVESNGGVPGDWVEFYNPGTTSVDIGGFVFKDNDDSHSYTIPSPSNIAAKGFLVLEQAAFGFDLDSSDSARLFDSFGTLVDSYTWTSHAATTYGRCPDGNIFITTVAPTHNAANSCPPWPGGASVSTVDGLNVFGTNLSGLIYEGSGASAVLWGIRNGPSTLYRLVFNGTIWTPDTTNDWGAGKTILYPSPNTTGAPDSEGVTFAGSSADGLYVSTERDNNNNGVSRLSVLRYDPSSPGATLTATHEWNLTADLPPVGPNLGLEAIAFLPDTFLTGNNFFDAGKNHTYDPSEYPNHGTGLFFVGVEATGKIYAYALDHSGNGAFTKIATITTDLPSVMDLNFDPLLSDLWVDCDDTCQGLTEVLRIDGTGKFFVAGAFLRPTGMPNFNNEGFAIASAADCMNNLRPVFWADDGGDNGHSIRGGTLPCSAVENFPDAIAPKASPTASPSANGAGWNSTDVTVTWNWTDNPGGGGIDNANCTVSTLSSGEGTLLLNATCKDLAGNTGHASFTVKVDKTNPTITPSAKKADTTAYTFGTWSNQTVTVHYACADSGSLIASCTADQVFSADGATSTSGSALDNAGRSADSGSLLVRIDKTLPSLAITSPTNASYQNVGQLSIDWTASDLGSGIALQSATLDSSTVTNGQKIDLSTQALGMHTVAVNVTDNAGNTASASVSFSVTAKVSINVNPGTPRPPTINIDSEGAVAVAILGSANFDVTTIDPASVAFGPKGAKNKAVPVLKDVNGDGKLDLTLRFAPDEVGLGCSDVSVDLTGKTLSSQQFAGSESIKTTHTLPCPRP